MILNILTRQCRLVQSVRPILKLAIPPHSYTFNCNIKTIEMSQKSITSFFKVNPLKIQNGNSTKNDVTDEVVVKAVKEESPSANDNAKKITKRQRLSSSSSESEPPVSSPVSSSGKKKNVKRQRIESSGSESETSENVQTVKTEPESPEDKSPTINKSTIKRVYGSSPKIIKKSPKKIKEDIDKTPKNKKVKSESEKKVTSFFQKKDNATVKVDNSQLTNDDKESPKKVSELEYNPSKAKYDPIKDACWSKGEEVPYLALAKTLEVIEETSARLKMIDILANFFRSIIVLTPEDLLPCIYLSLNQLAPAYHSLELGIAETYLLKAVGQCTGRTVAQLRADAARLGDLGAAAQHARATQRTMFAARPLRARGVLGALRDVARMSGQASVSKKIAKIQSLFVACRNCEAKYLVRSLEGKLRIGLAEQSLLAALALAAARCPPGAGELDAARGVPPDQFKATVEEHAMIIKTTYCECPNYEALVAALLQHGVRALPDHCRLTPGVPLKPMLAHPTKGLHQVFARFENQRFTCEWKYDGERAQLHVPAAAGAPDFRAAAVFSRNQEDNTSKYPDIIRRLPTLLKSTVHSCVLDCEAVAYDTDSKQILPFQILSTRKRKDAQEADIKVQVCVFVFDLLYLNGEPLVRAPLRERRRLLRTHFAEVPGEWQLATARDCERVEEVQQFLEEALRGSCEGLMVKTLDGEDARYDIARRSHNWLKLKKDYLEGVGDSIDAVVIGAYNGRGRRSGVFGGFLLACYDPATDEYQSLCKIGTGFSDEDLRTLSEELSKHIIDGPKNYYRYDLSHSPDAWVAPASVWEVRCADLSLSPSHRAALGLVEPRKGISLRFPRFVRVRTDKSPEQATSAQQVAELYLAQDQVRNCGPRPADLDDFY